jgi:hypothetical protein
MTELSLPLCFSCQRLPEDKHPRCHPYPDGIPREIILNTVECKYYREKTTKGVTPPDKNGRCHNDQTGALASCNGGSSQAPFLGFGDKKPKPGLTPKTPSKNTIHGSIGSFKNVTVDGNHMSPKHVEEAKAAFTNLDKQFSDIIPKVVKEVKTIDNFGNDPAMSQWMLQTAAAACEYYTDPKEPCLIRLNGAYFRGDTPSKEVAGWEQKNWCPKGCNTLTGVINHEFGHAVHSGVRRAVNPAVQESLMKQMTDNPISKQPKWSATAKINGVTDVDKRILRNETFAETFAAMLSGNYNDHPAVKAMKQLVAEYRKVE